MTVEFFVPGQPVGKGRPRATVRAGRARLYTPARTADAEARADVRWRKGYVYRRRECGYCGHRVTTKEKIVKGKQ